jgi:hypothetical protein
MSNLIPGNNSTTYTVNINSSVNGQLDSNGDTDWYRVQFQSGYAYQIWVEGLYSGLGTLADPYVAVYSSAGVPLPDENEFSLANCDAFVTSIPTMRTARREKGEFRCRT